MKFFYIILLIIVAVAAVIFAVQNTAAVTVTLFSWSVSGSLSLLLVVTLIIGFLLGILVMAPSVFRRSIQSSGLRRRVKRLEREKEKLHREKIDEGAISAAPDEPPENSASGSDQTSALPGGTTGSGSGTSAARDQ